MKVFDYIYVICGFGMMCLFLAAVMCSAVWIRVLCAVVAVVGLVTRVVDKIINDE